MTRSEGRVTVSVRSSVGTDSQCSQDSLLVVLSCQDFQYSRRWARWTEGRDDTENDRSPGTRSERGHSKSKTETLPPISRVEFPTTLRTVVVTGHVQPTTILAHWMVENVYPYPNFEFFSFLFRLRLHHRVNVFFPPEVNRYEWYPLVRTAPVKLQPVPWVHQVVPRGYR